MRAVIERRPEPVRLTPATLAIAAIGFCWIGLAAFWAAPAVYTIDGLIYHAMADAFARSASLFVENGYGEYRASPLRINLLRVHEGELVPQYPGGWGVLAAPVYLLGGIRGIILLNATAAALTLPLIWVMARALFDSRQLATYAVLIYGAATFAVDYALGVWPHGVATFIVTAAVAAVVLGWRRGKRRELHGALVAGLLLGFGINIRVDAIFAAVPVAIWLLGGAGRPYASSGLLLAGLVPGLAIASIINHAKFGVFSPAHYGAESGNATVGHFAELGPLFAVGVAAALALGSARVRARVYRPAGLAASGLAALLLLIAVPAFREVVAEIGAGFWILAVDFQSHPTPAYGAAVMEDGTLRMFGLIKKALLQSAPYAAAAVIVLPRVLRGPDRAALAFCLLFVALGIIPFAYGTWHGGMANNMRYFHHLLPVLAVLSAAAFCEIRGLASERPALSLAAALAVCTAALLYATSGEYSAAFLLQSTLPNALAIAAAALSLAVLATSEAMRGSMATLLRGVFVAGLATACVSAWYIDLAVSQQIRQRNLAVGELSAAVPAEALVVSAFPERIGVRLNRQQSLTAEARFTDGKIAPELGALVRRAFSEGRPVFVQGRFVARQLVSTRAAADFRPHGPAAEELEFYELMPPAGGEGG